MSSGITCGDTVILEGSVLEGLAGASALESGMPLTSAG